MPSGFRWEATCGRYSDHISPTRRSTHWVWATASTGDDGLRLLLHGAMVGTIPSSRRALVATQVPWRPGAKNRALLCKQGADFHTSGCTIVQLASRPPRILQAGERMTQVTIDGVPHRPQSGDGGQVVSPERLRSIVQDAHLNFLFGAGTPSAYFGLLGNVEDALSRLAETTAPDASKNIVRASIQACFFDAVLAPNSNVIRRDAATEAVLTSYANFLRVLNRILLKRHSSILAKQANLFTTNVDMVFEVALEQMGLAFSDGFSGKIQPRFDLSDFDTLRFRLTSRYEQRSEVPVFNLVKIHGSAAWLQQRKTGKGVEIVFDHGLSLVAATATALEQARDDLVEISDTRTIDVASLIEAVGARELSPAVAAFSKAYERLGIVNPDKQKFATTVLNETYYELIRRFANALEKENSVLFVHGFSFRDEHLRDVVTRSARTNPTLQVIVFCYSRGDLAEYESLIPDSEIKNGNIAFLAPAPPEDGEREVVATLDVVTSKYFVPIVADRFEMPDQRIELDIHVSGESGSDA